MKLDEHYWDFNGGVKIEILLIRNLLFLLWLLYGCVCVWVTFRAELAFHLCCVKNCLRDATENLGVFSAA